MAKTCHIFNVAQFQLRYKNSALHNKKKYDTHVIIFDTIISLERIGILLLSDIFIFDTPSCSACKYFSLFLSCFSNASAFLSHSFLFFPVDMDISWID